VGIGKSWKGAALLAVGAAVGATAVAVASVPDGNVIHACYQVSAPGSTVPAPTAGNVRIIDPSAGQACNTAVGAGPTEHALDWNVSGPQGSPGTPGTPGAPGKSVTLVAGNTMTLSGGQVVTIGNSPVATFRSLPIGTRSVATLSFTGGITTDILSYGFAANTGGSGGASGKAAVHDIQITKLTDKSSPKLFLACANGQHFKTATLVVRKAGGKQVVYTLTDVLIATAQSTDHSQKLTDSLTLNYAKLASQIGRAHA
jgi:hypothetical protein